MFYLCSKCNENDDQVDMKAVRDGLQCPKCDHFIEVEDEQK